MSEIKSISHQSVHSVQSAPAERSKPSEIVKESRPAEFRPLTKDQQENIKQSRNAEGKFAESAIRADAFRSLDLDKAGSDPTQTGPIFSREMKEVIKNMAEDEPPIKAKPFFKDPFRKSPGPSDDLDVREEEPITLQTDLSASSKRDQNWR